MDLKIALKPHSKVPEKSSAGAAAYDFFAYLPEAPQRVEVSFGRPVKIPLGIHMEIPPGYVMLLTGRSGMGSKHQVRLANCVGVIDSDYRGEVAAVLSSDDESGTSYYVNHGAKVAQGVIVRAEDVRFISVGLNDLSVTERGEGGFGSTGA